MHVLPKAKQDNLVLQHLDHELLVYDLVTNKAFSLNETSAVVFNACNGRTTFAELKAKHKFTDELIFLALDELKKESLLADDSYQSPFAGMSRREVARKVGLATMIALPVIIAAVAPSAAMAQSGACKLVGEPCINPTLVGFQGDCCRGIAYCDAALFINGTCRACVRSGTVATVTVPSSCSRYADWCCSGSIRIGTVFGEFTAECVCN